MNDLYCVRLCLYVCYNDENDSQSNNTTAQYI